MLKRQLIRFREGNLWYASLLLIIGALTYLLLIKQLGLYGDDWYLVFDAHTQGPEFFKVVFSSDRPARAYLMGLAYTMFGDHLVYYHLSAFFFRFLASIAFFWTLNKIWYGNKTANFLMALLFMIYPGFLFQVQPIDYQSQICSLGLAMLSIALTVKTFQMRSHFLVRAGLFVLSVLTGLFYLALVEYFLGLEFLRLFLVACLVWRETGKVRKEKIIKLILSWLPFSIIPVGFLIWRLFIFSSTRSATDVALQMDVFLASPILVGLRWLVNILYGAFNSIVSAWTVPFYNIVIEGDMRLKDILQMLAVGFGALVLLFMGLRVELSRFQDENFSSGWVKQAIWGGLAVVVASSIPIIIANRTVDFEYSRYTLAGVPGVVMIIVAGISLFKSSRVQHGLVGLLVSLAIMTHFGNAVNHVYQADSLRDFWWQVSWRAPSLASGTTLIADYSRMETPETYVIWGPANLIYYPERQSTVPIQIRLPAALPNDDTVNVVLGNGAVSPVNQRGNLVDVGFGSMLVLSQPDDASCVHALNGAIPELSLNDTEAIKLMASYSQTDRILTDAAPAMLVDDIFGLEPKHTWCFYYQKASLARQQGDWQMVIALGEEAHSYGYNPNNRIEWMPFLQAYVATGDMDSLSEFPGIMNEFPLIRSQTCRILKQTALETRPDDLQLKNYIEEEFCPYE